MTLFKKQYRIESSRRPGWDYAENGYYFITICTKDRECLFGEIQNEKMILDEFGIIIQEEWEKSFVIRKELSCNTYIIMPNHIHAIIVLDKNDVIPVETHGRASLHNNAHLQNDPSLQHNMIAPYRSPKSISSFVAGFKSVATMRINQIRNTPKMPLWQSRFHDRIIRDEIEFYSMKKYIADNPMHWEEDEFYAKAV